MECPICDRDLFHSTRPNKNIYNCYYCLKYILVEDTNIYSMYKIEWIDNYTYDIFSDFIDIRDRGTFVSMNLGD